jgi:hypothetical protein
MKYKMQLVVFILLMNSVSVVAADAPPPTRLQCESSQAHVVCDINDSNNCFYGPAPAIQTYGPVPLLPPIPGDDNAHGKLATDIAYGNKTLHLDVNCDSNSDVQITLSEKNGITVSAPNSIERSETTLLGSKSTVRSSIWVKCQLL